MSHSAPNFISPDLNGARVDGKSHARAGEPSDEALIASVAAGDEEAFRAVVDAYAVKLHRIAYRMVGVAGEAEDIVQEGLLRFWRHAPRLADKGPITLEAWLKRITINLAIDALRKARRVSEEEVPERADDAPPADMRIEAGQDQALARQLITQLNERQRAAIVLTYYEEASNEAAAQIMQMNIKAFESLLFRARAALRRAFDAHEAAAQALWKQGEAEL